MGKFEWYPYGAPGVALGTWTFVSKSKQVVLSESLGNKLTCNKSKDVGMVTGPKAGEDEITLEHCGDGSAACTSPTEATGVIKTNLLHTNLIGSTDVGLGGMPSLGEVWTEFVSPSGQNGYILEATCPAIGLAIKVWGFVGGITTPTWVRSRKFQITFALGAGEPGLMWKLNSGTGALTSPVGLSAVTTETFAENIEIRTY
jgi:hypothetical protein